MSSESSRAKSQIVAGSSSKQKSGVVRTTGTGGGFRGGSQCRSLFAVHKILEFLAGLEERNALGRNFHFFSSFRIAAHPPFTLSGAETPEAASFNLLAFLNGFDNAVENGFDDGLGLLARELGDLQHFFDQICLGQRRLLGHRGRASLESS